MSNGKILTMIIAISILIISFNLLFSIPSKAATIYSVHHTPTEPNPSHQVTIYAPGSGFIQNVTLYWEVNEMEHYQRMTFTTDRYWGMISAQPEYTIVQYWIIVSPQAGDGERYPEVGSFQYIVVPATIPDLCIDNETTFLDPDPYQTNVFDTERIQIHIDVKNKGWVNITNAPLTVIDNGVTLYNETIETIRARGDEYIDLDIQNPTPGQHYLQINGDPFKCIDEFNEDNNLVSYDFMIYTDNFVPIGDLYEMKVLPQGRYHTYRFESSDDYIRVKFNTNGSNVDFYVLTSSQFSAYSNGYSPSFQYERVSENTDSFEWFDKPSQTCYILIDNAAISVSGATPYADVTYTVTITHDDSTTIYVYQAIGLLLLLSVLCIVIYIIYRIQHRNDKTPPESNVDDSTKHDEVPPEFN